ncbi:hypothetical protein J7J83_03585 [bacterium]|nr:hypothetical protein [bacterium]
MNIKESGGKIGSFTDFFLGIDSVGRKSILGCLNKIAKDLTKSEFHPISVSALIGLERHVGQYHVAPILESIGLKINGDEVHMVGDFNQLQDALKSLENYTSPVEISNPHETRLQLLMTQFGHRINETLTNLVSMSTDAKDHI